MNRTESFLMATVLLLAVLVAVVSGAQYRALHSEITQFCTTTAAPLDLSSAVHLCKSVNYQEKS